jgi:hypothetical protein
VVRRLFGIFSAASFLVALVLSGGAGSAAAAGVVEGNFESGLHSWSTSSLYSRNAWAPAPRAQAEADFGFPLPAEVGANVAATSYAGSDSSFLSQAIELPAASNLKLSLYLFYKSEAAMAVPDRDTLFVRESGGGQNQQVRVDVLKANAPLESLSPNDILATLYASPTGGPKVLAPTPLSADLSQFAGQTILLRIANAVSEGEMTVGVGDISLAISPVVQPIVESAVLPTVGPTAGKLLLNRRAGSARLSVALPGPGTLTVSDARRQVAVASTFAAPRVATKPKPILIRTATAQAQGAQTVRVPIRPTAAAKKLLGKNGRLTFHLQLTFAPSSGGAMTESYKGTLLKRLRPTRR